MSSPIINPVTIQNLRALAPDDNDEFLKEIVGIFSADTPERLAELDSALAAGDMTTFARAAHSIKGSSANVGATALQELAQVTEAQAQSGDRQSLMASLLNLRQAFEATKAELLRLIDLGPGPTGTEPS